MLYAHLGEGSIDSAYRNICEVRKQITHSENIAYHLSVARLSPLAVHQTAFVRLLGPFLNNARRITDLPGNITACP